MIATGLVADVLVAALVIGLSLRLSAAFAPSFADVDEVPLKWLPDRSVVQSLPRRIALLLFPALLSLTMAGLLVLAVLTPADQRWQLVPGFVLIGVVFLAAQAFVLGRSARFTC